MFTYAVASDPAVAGFAMVSDRFLAVLAADADEPTALRLWDALSRAGTDEDSPASLASVLSEMAAHGITSLPDFALVELVDATTRSVALAVRGGAQILLPGGEVRSGRGVGSWSESTADDVTGLTLQLGPVRALLGRLPLGRGVVRADRLDWGAGGDGEAAPVSPTRTRRTTAAAEPDAAPVQTLRRERVAAPVADETELSRAHRRPAPAAAEPGAPGRAVLRIGPDRVVDLDRPVVLGRSPRAESFDGARLVALASPKREISGAHVEVRLDGEVLVVHDLDSTNGTIVREPGASPTLLRHGASARVSGGATLDLGDGVVAVFDLLDERGR